MTTRHYPVGSAGLPDPFIDEALRPGSDEAAVRRLFQALLDAWGRGDAAGYAALFTEDADYVSFDGAHTRGREAIAASHQPLFQRWLKGTRLTGRIESVRFLSPGIALVHATGSTVFPGERRPRPSRDSIQTLIAICRPDGWRFAAFHNTRVLRRSRLGWILFGIASQLFKR